MYRSLYDRMGTRQASAIGGRLDAATGVLFVVLVTVAVPALLVSAVALFIDRGPWRRSSAGRLPGPLTVDALQEQIGCRLLHPPHARIPEQRRTQIPLQRRREKEGADVDEDQM